MPQMGSNSWEEKTQAQEAVKVKDRSVFSAVLRFSVSMVRLVSSSAIWFVLSIHHIAANHQPDCQYWFQPW